MAGEPIFKPNTPGLEKLKAALDKSTEDAIKKLYKVFRTFVEEWKRRIQRVCPVEFGTMRQNWLTHTALEGRKLIGEVGTNIRSAEGFPYPVYLEYGTERIAGGKVLAWEEGMPAIMEWPAKMKDLANFRKEKDTRGPISGKIIERGVGKEGSAKFERAVKIVTKAMTSGQGEQMPFLRPTGIELRPIGIAAMIEAVQDSASGNIGGKKF